MWHTRAQQLYMRKSSYQTYAFAVQPFRHLILRQPSSPFHQHPQTCATSVHIRTCLLFLRPSTPAHDGIQFSVAYRVSRDCSGDVGQDYASP